MGYLILSISKTRFGYLILSEHDAAANTHGHVFSPQDVKKGLTEKKVDGILLRKKRMRKGTELIAVRCPVELLKEAEEKAAALRVSRSTLIVEAIRVQLEQIRKRRGFLVPPLKVSSRHKRKVSAQSSGGGEVS